MFQKLMKKMVGMTAIGVTLLMCISGCQKDAVEITGGYPVSEKEAKTEESEGIENKEKYVYICGAVMNAGVYEITEETRICEVVKMAGGFDEDADEDSVNLAAFAIDGEQIRIPYIGENLHIGEEDLIDLNEASSNDLCEVPGIGEARANAIIEYRESVGGFKEKEELMQVSGIKEATYKKIEKYFIVR